MISRRRLFGFVLVPVVPVVPVQAKTKVVNDLWMSDLYCQLLRTPTKYTATGEMFRQVREAQAAYNAKLTAAPATPPVSRDARA